MNYIVKFAVLAVTCFCFAIGCSENSPTSNDDDGLDGGARSASLTITQSSGGTVSVENDRGDIFTLTLLPNSVKQSTEITLTTRTEPPESPYSTSIVPGVSIQSDVLLDEPATLTLTFADPPDSIEFCSLYLAEAPDCAILLDYHEDTDTTIGGDIVQFGEYGCCRLTAGEVTLQSDVLESYLDQFAAAEIQKSLVATAAMDQNDPFDWKKAYRYAGWALHMIRANELFGREEKAEKQRKKLDETLEDKINKFLEKNVDDMCDPDYKQALMKYQYMVLKLGIGESPDLESKITARTEEMMDKCSSRFQLDIVYEQTSQLPGGADVLNHHGTVEFYLPNYTLESGDYGQLKGEGSLRVTGGGSSTNGREVCNWTNSGKIDVTVGGNLTSDMVDGSIEHTLHIQLTLSYNVYQEKECCYDEKCYDLSGSTMVGSGPGFTIDMPVENGHSIQRPFGAGITTGTISYTLHVLNSKFD